MYGLIVIFPFRGMFRIFLSLVLLKSGILSVSEATLHIMLLLWQQMLWLVVDLTTVFLCSGVSLFLIFMSFNVFKIVLLESLPTPLSTHTSLLLERLSIGWLLNSILFLKLPYWCISSYKMAIQNILYLSLNLDIVFIIHVKAKLMVGCSVPPPPSPGV